MGGGPRELGQSWYKRERRTIFGMVLYIKSEGVLLKFHLNVISECLTHDAVFVKLVLQDLFASDFWKKLAINDLAIWCDNAPHFKNKSLLHFFLTLCQEKEFKAINFCFFEAYHGKGDVDSMFGTMTKWMTEWKKVNFLNTTEDLLNCFYTNNQFTTTPQLNFFYKLSFAPTLWTQLKHKTLTGIKIKNVNCFEFSYTHQNTIITATIRVDIGESGNFITNWEKATTRRQIKYLPLKKAPKYSSKIETVNSSSLTSSDEIVLQKKAKLWGISLTQR